MIWTLIQSWRSAKVRELNAEVKWQMQMKGHVHTPWVHMATCKSLKASQGTRVCSAASVWVQKGKQKQMLCLPDTGSSCFQITVVEESCLYRESTCSTLLRMALLEQVMEFRLKAASLPVWQKQPKQIFLVPSNNTTFCGFVCTQGCNYLTRSRIDMLISLKLWEVEKYKVSTLKGKQKLSPGIDGCTL